MNMDQLVYLTDREKERYMNVSQLFGTAGWDEFVENYRIKAEASLQAGANSATWDDNRINLGARLAYEEFVNLEESVEQEFLRLSEERKESQQTQDELDYE